MRPFLLYIAYALIQILLLCLAIQLCENLLDSVFRKTGARRKSRVILALHLRPFGKTSKGYALPGSLPTAPSTSRN
jgi:hypothetical protein